MSRKSERKHDGEKERKREEREGEGGEVAGGEIKKFAAGVLARAVSLPQSIIRDVSSFQCITRKIQSLLLRITCFYTKSLYRAARFITRLTRAPGKIWTIRASEKPLPLSRLFQRIISTRVDTREITGERIKYSLTRTSASAIFTLLSCSIILYIVVPTAAAARYGDSNAQTASKQRRNSSSRRICTHVRTWFPYISANRNYAVV